LDVDDVVEDIVLGWNGLILTVLPPEIFDSKILEAMLTIFPPEVVECAEAMPTNITVNAYRVGEDTVWKQGSWVVEYRGANHVWLYVYGSYDVQKKVYYDVNGVRNTVIDAVRNVTQFIVDAFNRLLC